MNVSYSLMETLYPAYVCAAGLCHDLIEDVDGDAERLGREFVSFGYDGEQLVVLVETVTKPKGLEWDEAQKHALEKLREGSDHACAIAAADKIHNMEASEGWAREGFLPNDYLARDWQTNLAKFEAIYEVVHPRIHPALAARFNKCLEQWRRSGHRLDAVR